MEAVANVRPFECCCNLNVRANTLLAVAVAVQNKPGTNVAHALLGFLYDKYKRQQNREFMCPTEPNSDIPITGRWILAQSFSLKGGPVELDVEDEDTMFEDTKAFLDCWYSEGRRPNSPYNVWLFFTPKIYQLRHGRVPKSSLNLRRIGSPR